MTASVSSETRLPISVIIAMYNTGKYIGECLDSFCAQTFKDFEIIVIDDCSTDDGNSIVRSYIKKFNGRLKLVRLKKNSGNNGIPNNMGLALSRGEYVVFMDSDDTVTPDMLEKLYTVAKDFDADVVTCEKHYRVPENRWDDTKFMNNLKPWSYQTGDFVNEPTLVSEDIAERVKDCDKRRFLWELWQKLIRRDLLVNNDISITNEMCNDMLLTCFLIYTAKRIVRVPYALNYYRLLDNSITHQKREPLKQMKKYLRALTVGIKHLDTFLSKQEFFQAHPESKCLALDTYFREIWERYIWKVYNDIPLKDRNDALREEFSHADNSALAAFLFEVLDKFQKSKNEILFPSDFRPYITARIDIKLLTKEGHFYILSVSDDKASVTCPAWFQENGIGYVITSYAGNLEFVARSIVDGQIMLILKGMDIRQPDDRNKRIPYWIDYTKLFVNGKMLLDKLTPAWHDKPYRQKLDVKAGEEVKFQVEWLPHRSDYLPVALNVAKIQENKATTFENISNYPIARVDIQLKFKSEQGNLQIVSVSDEKANVRNAAWLPKNNIGYAIQSDVGKLEFVAKAFADGQIILNLRGRDVRDPKDKLKRIPLWVEYKSLTVNGKPIFDTITAIWHDKPFRYKMDVKANDEITVNVEWLPRRNDNSSDFQQ